jgi:hypothetical protein
MARPTKYKAVRTEIDGHTFPSKAEAHRYQHLKLLEKAGQITNLSLQPRYALDVNGVHIANYIADFRYWDETGRVIEDCKGVQTPVYKLKKKLMLACHGIVIKESR